jgi:enamine deaminase RidA (YjgF/YER057c/UK114 family)
MMQGVWSTSASLRMNEVVRKHLGPRMSQIVVSGGTVYLAGQVASKARGKSVADQAAEILETIDRYLEEAGSHKSLILQAMVWLTDMGSFAEFNGVWDAWVDPRNPPVRACVEAVLAHPDYKVEVMITAAVKSA